ncbi:MAG TPA: SDR family NAD(P)-dependent oxidoreductase, partial [Gemmatimonadota bacterium]|nr:SDR family NAD(P)-dependent oxidoreductase [Gemmatimonadota bacterium]
MRLAGRSALITGAASGIGRATALAFAREGADVTVTEPGRGGSIVIVSSASGLRASAGASAYCSSK